MVYVRLGPALTDVMEILALAYWNKSIVDQTTIVRRHEFHVAGPRRRDHRLALAHAFGKPQPEAFGTMQRDVRVHAPLQCLHITAIDNFVAD